MTLPQQSAPFWQWQPRQPTPQAPNLALTHDCFPPVPPQEIPLPQAVMDILLQDTDLPPLDQRSYCGFCARPSCPFSHATAVILLTSGLLRTTQGPTSRRDLDDWPGLRLSGPCTPRTSLWLSVLIEAPLCPASLPSLPALYSSRSLLPSNGMFRCALSAVAGLPSNAHFRR